ncbi:hypothetical protein TNCV_1077721 [Trichonephila clavipes]|uniref:Uncharacterized protein n=1 Tax=Trichonephila clavipes TaxID=2585209 RepID=A0A8X6RTT9_TRICX|nr:hypothetical protein TNCV_1077721 [Trichonephila clavipes]
MKRFSKEQKQSTGKEKEPKNQESPRTQTDKVRTEVGECPENSGRNCLPIPRGRQRASIDPVSEFDRGRIVDCRDLPSESMKPSKCDADSSLLDGGGTDGVAPLLGMAMMDHAVP